MEWLNDLAARLPALRDDEPPEIRRRIIAELRDHLQSAFERELVRTGSPDQAEKNVLKRFGDPARLARKLWYDALWEKIMSRRLIWCALSAVLLLSLGSLGLASFLVVQTRLATQAMLDQSRADSAALLAENRSTNQLLVEQNREANEALLTKVKSLEGTDGSPGKSLEWNPLRVRLGYEKTGGEPAAGFAVRANGHLLDTGKQMSLQRQTDADGRADFGLVRPGEHSLGVFTPWGEWLRPFSVTVLPGENQTLEIICPRQVEEADVSITVDWPAELASKALWLLCDFTRSPRQVADHWWSPKDSLEYVAVDDTGKLIHYNARLFPNRVEDRLQLFQTNYMREIADKFGIYSASPNFEMSWCVWLPAIAPVLKLRWPVGTYRAGLYCAAGPMENDDEGLPTETGLMPRRFLGGLMFGNPIIPGGGGDDHVTVRTASRPGFGEIAVQTFRPAKKIAPAQFEVVAGKVNEWRISPPTELTDLVIRYAADDAEPSSPTAEPRAAE